MSPVQERPMERDILLAQNEFTYIQDITKGVITLNVGPHKCSLSNTERVVVFEPRSRKFKPLEEITREDPRQAYTGGVQQFAEASLSQYIVLENPRKETKPYVRGQNDAAELAMGKKVVIPGPNTFPLWPGQLASVIDGHKLKEDEYLLIRAYEPVEAEEKDGKDGATKKITIQIGTEKIIKGSEHKFYIPQAGFEVVPAEDNRENRFVRKAIKLMDGEYCVLLKPNGEKKYVNGPSMVIPEPQDLIQVGRDARPIYKAYGLKPENGLHLYVAKDFETKEGEQLANILGTGKFKIGQELFVSGKEGLFFPNENLEVLGEVKPISLAEDEGIYVRDNRSGVIKTAKGPLNLLPDPIKEKVVGRNLDASIAGLCNIKSRGEQKAISVYVPPNHAMMVTSEKGRKIIKGPVTHILDYSEDLETLALSTGTPKSDKTLLKTVYLQVEGNKVSDEVEVETQDHVKLKVKLSYRISFEKEQEKWFDVKNYVGLLCDHLSSLVRSTVQKSPLEQFYSSSTEVVRDAVLGKKEGVQTRAGRAFAENGMRVYDLEVLQINVLDEGIGDMLTTAQQNAFRLEMEKREAERRFDLTKSTEDIKQKTNAIKIKSLESELELLKNDEKVKIAAASTGIAVNKIQQIGSAENTVEANQTVYAFDKAKAEDDQARKLEILNKETEAFKERMSAVTPDFVAAVTRLGDQNLIVEATKNLGQASLFENKSVYDMMKTLWGGLPFNLPNLAFLEKQAAKAAGQR